ncbi:MAG: GNAT family N-acetyltransferase [Ruminiclostridium sp.]|nr:GNAT family N-acetyltransferase [Ruminiclostridium sp.]
MKIENKLIGKRIAIRSYQKSDLDFVSGMWFDKENGRYLSAPEKEYIDEKFQRAVDGLEDSSFGYYFVAELLDTGELIGSCSTFPDSDDKSVFDIGYCVVKSHWREGFGSEIVSVLLDWIKSEGGTTVTAEVAKENKASCGLLKKLGFEVVKETSFKKYNMGIEFESFILGKKLK